MYDRDATVIFAPRTIVPYLRVVCSMHESVIYLHESVIYYTEGEERGAEGVD